MENTQKKILNKKILYIMALLIFIIILFIYLLSFKKSYKIHLINDYKINPILYYDLKLGYTDQYTYNLSFNPDLLDVASIKNQNILIPTYSDFNNFIETFKIDKLNSKKYDSNFFEDHSLFIINITLGKASDKILFPKVTQITEKSIEIDYAVWHGFFTNPTDVNGNYIMIIEVDKNITDISSLNVKYY